MVSLQSWILPSFADVYGVQDRNRKWFLLACLLSLQIFEGSKILYICFLTKITFLNTLFWNMVAVSLLYFIYRIFNFVNFTESYCVQVRKWFSFTCLLPLRIFEFTKIRKCCFLTKILCFSKHSFVSVVSLMFLLLL